MLDLLSRPSFLTLRPFTYGKIGPRYNHLIIMCSWGRPPTQKKVEISCNRPQGELARPLGVKRPLVGFSSWCSMRLFVCCFLFMRKFELDFLLVRFLPSNSTVNHHHHHFLSGHRFSQKPHRHCDWLNLLITHCPHTFAAVISCYTWHSPFTLRPRAKVPWHRSSAREVLGRTHTHTYKYIYSRSRP
jgi:hypothetical protein